MGDAGPAIGSESHRRGHQRDSTTPLYCLSDLTGKFPVYDKAVIKRGDAFNQTSPWGRGNLAQPDKMFKQALDDRQMTII